MKLLLLLLALSLPCNASAMSPAFAALMSASRLGTGTYDFESQVFNPWVHTGTSTISDTAERSGTYGVLAGAGAQTFTLSLVKHGAGTFSFWLKKTNTGGEQTYSATLNGSTIISGTISTLTTTWQQYSATIAAGNSGTFVITVNRGGYGDLLYMDDIVIP